MRPSSTSGASRAAVAGASVTPSIPWPRGDEEPAVPGNLSDQRETVGGRGPQAGPRRERPVGLRLPAGEVGARCREKPLAHAWRRFRPRCAELEDAGDAHAARVRAQADPRLGEVERVARRRSLPGDRHAVAARGLDRDTHAEAVQEAGRTASPAETTTFSAWISPAVGRQRPSIRVAGADRRPRAPRGSPRRLRGACPPARSSAPRAGRSGRRARAARPRRCARRARARARRSASPAELLRLSALVAELAQAAEDLGVVVAARRACARRSRGRSSASRSECRRRDRRRRARACAGSARATPARRRRSAPPRSCARSATASARTTGSSDGRRTNASPRVTSWRTPSRTIPGAGSGTPCSARPSPCFRARRLRRRRPARARSPLRPRESAPMRTRGRRHLRRRRRPRSRESRARVRGLGLDLGRGACPLEIAVSVYTPPR